MPSKLVEFSERLALLRELAYLDLEAHHNPPRGATFKLEVLDPTAELGTAKSYRLPAKREAHFRNLAATLRHLERVELEMQGLALVRKKLPAKLRGDLSGFVAGLLEDAFALGANYAAVGAACAKTNGIMDRGQQARCERKAQRQAEAAAVFEEVRTTQGHLGIERVLKESAARLGVTKLTVRNRLKNHLSGPHV